MLCFLFGVYIHGCMLFSLSMFKKEIKCINKNQDMIMVVRRGIEETKKAKCNVSLTLVIDLLVKEV